MEIAGARGALVQCARPTCAAVVLGSGTRLAAPATTCLLLIFGLLWVAPAAQSYSTDPHIAAFVQVFANGAPAEVRCPDSLDEWSFDLGDPPSAADVYGRTLVHSAVVEFRPDLCSILDNLTSSTADDSTQALAVLVLLHESYHVRHWKRRLDEARVECAAIRHFRAGVRVVGGSQQLADRLFPLALSWHNQIAAAPGYFLPACKLPQSLFVENAAAAGIAAAAPYTASTSGSSSSAWRQ